MPTAPAVAGAVVGAAAVVAAVVGAVVVVGIEPSEAYPEKLIFQWHITDQCNLSCQHCYQEGFTADGSAFDYCDRVLIQLDELTTHWKSCKGTPVPLQITVTGGEPLLHPQLVPLLKKIRAGRQARLALLSNGTLITASIARQLQALDLDFVQVSIDGGRKVHDQIRGAGSFDKAVAGIRQLVKAKLRTSIAFTVHRGNAGDFPTVARLARRLKVDHLWLDRMIPAGQGAALTESVLSAPETRDFLAVAFGESRSLRQRYLSKGSMSLNRALQFLYTGSTPYSCSAGETLLTLMPNGDVYPCRRLPMVCGNIYPDSLLDIYYGPCMAQLRQQDPPPECRHCRFARECHGGLRCLSYACNGTATSADPGCWIAYP